MDVGGYWYESINHHQDDTHETIYQLKIDLRLDLIPKRRL